MGLVVASRCRERDALSSERASDVQREARLRLTEDGRTRRGSFSQACTPVIVILSHVRTDRGTPIAG